MILAVNEHGSREVIAIEYLPTESATGWQDMFGQLRERGLREIGLIVADSLSGLDTAVAQMWPRTPLQWCVTHIKRQVMGKVRYDDRRELAEDLRQVFQTGVHKDSADQGWKRWQALCTKWQDKYRTFSSLKNWPQYRNGFTYLDFDYRVHAMIYTTNWIERLNRDFRRVLRMRGSMPSEDAVMTLMGKVCVDKRAYQRKLPRLDLDKTLFPDTEIHTNMPLND